MNRTKNEFSWNGWNWNIEDTLGSGGYGSVYKAQKIIGNKTFYSAIKVITIPKNKDEIVEYLRSGLTMEELQVKIDDKKEKYLQEVQLLYDLRGNSNIVNVEQYDVQKTQYELTIRSEKYSLTGYQIFIQMEYLDSFKDYMASNQLSKKQILGFGIDICTALEICMEKNIIHRDIKPSNIMVHKVGDIYHYKLTDFGLGRYLNRGLAKSFVGTDYYMAPEIDIFGKKYDITVDYYSLGLILYQLLNHNKLPFVSEETDVQLAIRKRNEGEMLPAPETDWPEMFEIIKKCCAFYPKDRYRTAIEIKHELISLQKKMQEEEKEIELHNPVIQYDEELKKESITWDCVYYNSFPQKEIEMCPGIEYRFPSEAWDSNGELCLNGEKYKKVIAGEGEEYIFKYEPIVWRVLEVKNGRALLLSDLIVFYGSYDETLPDEKYFLLDQEELKNPKYGFKENFESADEARGGKYTEFVKVNVTDNYNTWWIRSDNKADAQRIIPSGTSSGFGFSKKEKAGIRPAVYVRSDQIKKSDYAGTKTIKRRVW